MIYLWRLNVPPFPMHLVLMGYRYMTQARPIRAFHPLGCSDWFKDEVMTQWLNSRTCWNLLELLDTASLFPAGFTKTIGTNLWLTKFPCWKNLIKPTNTEYRRAKRRKQHEPLITMGTGFNCAWTQVWIEFSVSAVKRVQTNPGFSAIIWSLPRPCWSSKGCVRSLVPTEQHWDWEQKGLCKLTLSLPRFS